MKHPRLSDREQQTLDRLIAGDQEKQIARQLKLSKNTVHVHVKSIYRKYSVCTRPELLAIFIEQLRREAVAAREAAPVPSGLRLMAEQLTRAAIIIEAMECELAGERAESEPTLKRHRNPGPNGYDARRVRGFVARPLPTLA